MSLENTIAVAVVLGVFGLAVLIVLWPGPKHGARLLRRWGMTDPSEPEVAEAVRYLKRRRFWYPWLFFALPLLGHTAGNSPWWSVGWTLLLGGLLGEFLALRPKRGARREASLAPRGLTDVVPGWALVLLGLSLAGGMVRTILAADRAGLAVVVVCGVVACLILVLAVNRPAAGGMAADLVLRVRSGRVAAGLAIVVPAALPATASGGLVSLLVFAGCLVAGLAVAGPDKHVAAAVA